MLSTLRNAWKVPDLKKRIIFTIFLVAIYRLGNHIPVPGVDTSRLTNLANNGLFGFYDLISGGAFSRFSIFALGVGPYINASIIMQLLTIAIPFLEQLSKEGEDGRKKIQKYTRYSAVAFGILQAFSQYFIIRSTGAITNQGKLNMFIIIVTITTASVFLMWLGDQITDKGLGNGISLLIFINIISRLPSQVGQIYQLQASEAVSVVSVVLLLVAVIAMLVSVILMSLAERRIPVQYAGRTVGNKTMKGQSTHIPINMNGTGVIAIIFAMSVMGFPAVIAQFSPTSWFAKVIVNGTFSPFNTKSWVYALVYFFMIIFFAWFYMQVTFKPDEMAENMHKSSGFIPGIRPGDSTARYIEKVLGRVSVIGGTFAGVIATFPILVAAYSDFGNSISFGGTTVLILVGVALDGMRQLEAQLVMRHYQGFLK